MRDVQAEAAYLQLVFHDDDETPRDFVVDLIRSVFSQTAADAKALSVTVERTRQGGLRDLSTRGRRGAASAARQRIKAAGHSMLITTEAGDDVGQR